MATIKADVWSNNRGLSRLDRQAMGVTLPAVELNGQSEAILILSDSTGREPSLTGGCFYAAAQQIAAKYPNMPVVVQGWDPTAQAYLGKTNLNASAVERHLLMLAPDATARTRSLANADIGSWTDLDLRLDLATDDWTPAATASLCGQWGSAGTYGHRLRLLSTGGLRYEWSNDATAINTVNSTATLGFADGARRMIRVTHDVDNGAAGNTVTFWHKLHTEDTWTQLGSPVVTAGTTTIARPAARQFEIGGTGSTSVVAGKYYGIEYMNGINGGFVSPQPIETWQGNENVTVNAGVPTLYVFVGAQGGAALDAADDAASSFVEAARWPKMVPILMCPTDMVLNTGHNEQDKNAAWAAELDSYLTAARARNPFATFWYMNQNPRLDVIGPVHSHRIRQGEAWARRNGVGVIDTYTAWLKTGDVTPLLQGDLLHPDADGVVVSAAAIFKALA